ncbi:MAG: DUF2784 domain-containing protein [Betaproteobacteria bacterium]|nr:DUF2784 domain-containing protein [Betaproteobacteria bacterium]
MNAAAADLVLIVHFLFVLFVTGGLAVIWIGAALGHAWVRNLWFRLAHLAAIVLVVVESVVGVACPLTVWEDALRSAGDGERSFVARWVRRILYYDFPEWVFTVIYVLFALAVIVTFVKMPPRRRRH